MVRFKVPTVDLLLLSVVVVWGLNFAVMKGLYTYFHPFAYNALRFALASASLVAVLMLSGKPLMLERSDLPAIVGLGLLSTTLYQFMFAFGLDHTLAGNSALVMSFSPVLAYLTGILLKSERISGVIVCGIVLSSAGVAEISIYGSRRAALGTTWKGDLMTLGAACCWGLYTGSAGRLVVKYGALRLTVLVMLAGSVFLIPLSLPWVMRQDWRHITPGIWLAVAYSSLLSIVYCYIVWSYALARVGVARTAVYSNLIPIVALAGGWALLGERPGTPQCVGAALVLTGVFLVRRRNPPALPDE
jgi:drug/metabolite transporter (DMT)-like permease